jgi:hypothetical protein
MGRRGPDIQVGFYDDEFPDFVIPGRVKDANYDAQLRIGESRDSGFELRSPRNDAKSRSASAW